MKIIAGLQTGADRAGLDAAAALGFATGGQAAAGYRTEDGPDPSLAGLHLVAGGSPESRTARNVADADATYEKEIVVNVDEMPFVVAKPHHFGNVFPVADSAGVKIDQAQIGSCANGRFEDIEIAARMLKGREVAKGVRFLISPASQQVYLQCLKAGLITQLIESGAQVITPGCGICQPRVGFLSDGEVCITATTRNYKGRKGSLNAEIYLGGPLSVAAAAIAGKIINPKEVFNEL